MREVSVSGDDSFFLAGKSESIVMILPSLCIFNWL